MADDTTTPDAATNETPAATDVPDTLGDAGKKALAEERKNARQAAKERDALATRLKEFEDRDKTEAQKLTERAEAAERRAADLESRSLRLEVAAEKGLTPAQAKRLSGSTREELEADADELREMFAPAAAAPGDPVEVAAMDLGIRSAAPAALNGDGLEQALRQKLGIR